MRLFHGLSPSSWLSKLIECVRYMWKNKENRWTASCKYMVDFDVCVLKEAYTYCSVRMHQHIQHKTAYFGFVSFCHRYICVCSYTMDISRFSTTNALKQTHVHWNTLFSFTFEFNQRLKFDSTAYNMSAWYVRAIHSGFFSPNYYSNL